MQIVNAPGRFDAPADLLAHDLTRWTASPNAAVFLTEMAPKAHADVLARDGWTLAHKGGAGQGECAILTRDAHYVKILATRWLKVWDGGGKARLSNPMFAVAVVAETVNGHIDVLTGLHTPAHVEGIWAHIPLPSRTKAKILLRHNRTRVRTYLQVMHAWRHATMSLASEFHADDVIAAPDGNLDAGKPWVRDLLARAWPGMHLAHTKDPDLGRRTVGWVLTTMTPGASHVEKAKGSDHDAGVYTFTRANATPTKLVATTALPPAPFLEVVYNGALMDNKTKTAVQLGEKRLGYSLTILQGCYNPGGVSQSAGTHDGGQVIDFAPFDFATKVKVFREMGWFIWHRAAIPGVWGEHIHGGIRNGGTLSPSAKAQQVDYDGTPPRDGLAGHSLDPTFHPDPPVGFDYNAAWKELQ